jgi:hypothetical protein
MELQYELLELKAFCNLTLMNFCTLENAIDLFKLAKLYNLSEASGQILAFIRM